MAHIDVGGRTFLPVCDVCGWRGYTTLDRASARLQGDQHEYREHPPWAKPPGVDKGDGA